MHAKKIKKKAKKEKFYYDSAHDTTRLQVNSMEATSKQLSTSLYERERERYKNHHGIKRIYPNTRISPSV